MSNVIRISEEVWGVDAQPKRLPFKALELVHSQLSVAEIISEWVKAEFESPEPKNTPEWPIALTRAEIFAKDRGQPEVPETLRSAQRIAVEAFRDGRVLFFWNDQQISDPDKKLSILGDNEAEFVKLFPMVGG